MARQTASERLDLEFQVAGGYRLLRPSVEFLPAWDAYRQKRISWLSVRVVAAAHALLSTRCMVPEGEFLLFRVEELAGLLRVPLRRVRRSLSELARESIMTFEPAAIRFVAAEALQEGRKDNDTGREGEKAPPEASRVVATPRRLLRAVARGELTRAESAVALSAVIRCVWVRKGRVVQPFGTLPVRFVEEVFGVDERSIVRAKRSLEKRGFFSPLKTPWWHRQRYGVKYEVSLAWCTASEAPGAVEVSGTSVDKARAAVENAPTHRTEMTPRGPGAGQRLAPPMKNQKPSPTGKLNQHQQPAKRPAPGVHTQKLSPGEQPEPRPSLQSVRLEDLNNTSRLLQLFEDYIRKGYAEGSEAERLRFVAAAERALRKGTTNPCGFFVRLVKWRLWENISAIDEEAARARIKKHLWERPLPAEFRTTQNRRQRGADLSDDAIFVLNVWRICARGDVSLAPREALRRANLATPWDDVRYAQAERELRCSGLTWDEQERHVWSIPGLAQGA